MVSRFSLILISILVITDAWLLSHPNLLGRFGIWFYKYEYLKDFPRALITVCLLIGFTIGLVELVKRFLPSKGAAIALAFMLVTSLTLFLATLFKFSSSTYRYTGSGFIWGAYLLPILMSLIILQGIYDLFRSKRLH